jgi:hypothetical protein
VAQKTATKVAAQIVKTIELRRLRMKTITTPSNMLRSRMKSIVEPPKAEQQPMFLPMTMAFEYWNNTQSMVFNHSKYSTQMGHSSCQTAMLFISPQLRHEVPHLLQGLP